MLVHEFGKFGIVGIVGAIVQFGLQNALYGRTGLTASVVIATCIATSVTFLGNRYWAFEHRKTVNVGRETVLFFFFNLVGMLFPTVSSMLWSLLAARYRPALLRPRHRHRRRLRDPVPAVLLPQVRLQSGARGAGRADGRTGDSALRR